MEALTNEEYHAFCQDLWKTSQAIKAGLSPDHMNYELLGNSNPHLHWHVVPRYRSDPRWGRPIWEDWPRNEFNINRYTLSEEEYREIVELIQDQMEKGKLADV